MKKWLGIIIACSLCLNGFCKQDGTYGAKTNQKKSSLESAIEQTVNFNAYHKFEPYELGTLEVYEEDYADSMMGQALKVYTVEGAGNKYIYRYNIGKKKNIILREEPIGKSITSEKDFKKAFKKIRSQVEDINDDYAPVILDLILSKYSLRNIEEVKSISTKTEGIGWFKNKEGKDEYREKMLITVALHFTSNKTKQAKIELTLPDKSQRTTLKVVGTLGQGVGLLVAAAGTLTSELGIGVPVCAAGICMYNMATNEKTPVYYDAKIISLN